MNPLHLLRQLLDGNIRKRSQFAQNLQMDEDTVQEHLDELEEQGIVRQLPQGYFVTAEFSDDDREKEAAQELRKRFYTPADDTVEVTVDGELMEEPVTFESEKEPSEFIPR